MNRRVLTGGVALAALIYGGNTSPCDASDEVDLRVGCVLASNSGQELDNRLVALQSRLDRLFRYTSYSLVKEKRERVALGGKMGFDVPGGRYLLVIPKEYRKDGTWAMKVMLLEGNRPIVDTTISLRNRSTFLVAGPQHKDGAVILAIGAELAQ